MTVYKMLSVVEGEEPVSLGTKINISLIIINSKLSRAVTNVSFSEPIPSQMILNSTSISEGLPSVSFEGISSVNHSWSSISPGEEKSFWMLLEVRNTSKSTIRFNVTKVDYIVDEFGSWAHSYSNTVTLQIESIEMTTTGTEMITNFNFLPPPIHDLTFPAIILVIGIPLTGIGFTYFILRRIKL